MPTIDNWRATLMRAAINCPHGIVDSEVLLQKSGKQSDGNALAQLADRLAEAVKPLLDERDHLAAENSTMRARLDRAVNAAEEHFGEDAIRYKISLFQNGRARNVFPPELDGRWVAFQRADNDAHIGLCDRINALAAEVEALRADAGRWRHALTCVRIAQHGDFIVSPDDPTGIEHSIAGASFVREVDAAMKGDKP